MKKWVGEVRLTTRAGKPSKRGPFPFEGAAFDKALEDAQKIVSKYKNSCNCHIGNIKCICTHCDDRGRVVKEVKGVLEYVKCTKCKGRKVFEDRGAISVQKL